MGNGRLEQLGGMEHWRNKGEWGIGETRGHGVLEKLGGMGVFYVNFIVVINAD